jgi:hypothetical protein
METVEATCPICHTADTYGAELIGRYTVCPHCRSRFYVRVPTLAEAQAEAVIAGPKLEAAIEKHTTLDDLLWDTQQGTRFVIKTLWKQKQSIHALTWLVIGLSILGLANFLALLILLLR